MTARVLSLFPWPQLSADNFDACRQLYPAERRGDRVTAQRAWAKMTGPERAECLRVIPQWVDKWVDDGTEVRFIPLLSTFLNQRRWEWKVVSDHATLSRDLGQCDWNKNGKRDPDAGACCERATRTDHRTSNVYCEAHALRLGLVRRKA